MRTSLFLLLLCLVVGTPTQGKKHAKGSNGEYKSKNDPYAIFLVQRLC